MHDLTGFQRDILYVVAGLQSQDKSEKPYGVEIKEALEEYLGKNVHHGWLYPNLDTLHDKELIEKGSTTKRKNFYILTERGKKEIAARQKWVNGNVSEVVMQVEKMK